MKPAPFDYIRPESLAEAISLLGDDDVIIAGGQSLLPLLSLRLTHVSRLVDISRIPELRRTSETDDHITFGAGLRHSEIEDGQVPDPLNKFLARVASNIAYRSIRNNGTIGGSIAMADPAADWPTTFIALRANAVIVGPQGERRQSVEDLIDGTFSTTLTTGEIISAFEFRKLSHNAGMGYVKVTRKSGAFAMSICVAIRDDSHRVAEVVLGAASSKPIKLRNVATLMQAGITGMVLSQAITDDLNELKLLDDYERRLHSATVRKAVLEAIS